MAHQQPIPEIRAAAFAAAREKCALSVEELAHLACLSKKQIQQIENGGRDAFYSPAIKYIAAKKVAQLIQLDEKEAFDSGPQAELPLAPAADPEVSAPAPVAALLPKHDNTQGGEKDAVKHESTQTESAQTGTIKSDIENAVMQPSDEGDKPSKSIQSSPATQRSSVKKWIWLLPVGAVALLLVQFQPLLQDQLDAVMGKSKPVEVVVLTATPVDATPANLPAEPPASVTPAQPPASATSAATPPVAPVIAASPALAVAANPACPLPDASIENYKSPSPNKPGNMVYVKMPTAQIVCVEDGSGKMQSRAMEPGLGYSFYGKPPFKLLTSGLSSAEIFFQGFRVRPSNADSKSILLVEVD
jgi:DNA-binding XRE family transcriptional regulator